MKKHFFLATAFFIVSAVLPLAAQNPTALESFLKSRPKISKVERLPSGDFAEKFLVNVKQQVVEGEPIYGFFEQRVFIMHVGEDRPTVIITEGYDASYGSIERYREEVSRLFNTNIVLVEHRYFNKSTPQPREWRFLTAENAMRDLHKVRTIMGDFYKGKWISTGISKGGQTALMYRTFFPEDVDITVSYVGPLCRDVEDGRHEGFIAKVPGTAEDRRKVEDFQHLVLQKRDALFPAFKAFCDTAKMKFTLPLEEIYDYCALEYSFSFWQWGSPVEDIPTASAPDSVILGYFLKMAGPDYFIRETPTQSFFIQAARELGYYGYDTKPFKNELRIKSAKGYLKKLFLPDSYRPLFSKKLYNRMSEFVATTDKNIIFIYGGNDPWTAAAVPNPNKPNILYMVQPGGSHRTRISTLPEDMKQKVMDQIAAWLAQ